jgi:hypothetical protein
VAILIGRGGICLLKSRGWRTKFGKGPTEWPLYELYLILAAPKFWSVVSHLRTEVGFYTQNTYDLFWTGYDAALFWNILYNIYEKTWQVSGMVLGPNMSSPPPHKNTKCRWITEIECLFLWRCGWKLSRKQFFFFHLFPPVISQFITPFVTVKKKWINFMECLPCIFIRFRIIISNKCTLIHLLHVYKILLHVSALMGHLQGAVHYKTPI